MEAPLCDHVREKEVLKREASVREASHHACTKFANQLQKCSSRCGLIRGLSKNCPGPENVLVTHCVAFPLAANFYEEAIYRSIILFPPLFYSVWKPTMSELDTQSFNLPSFARSIVLAYCQWCVENSAVFYVYAYAV